jgi:hypothetical protein
VPAGGGCPEDIVFERLKDQPKSAKMLANTDVNLAAFAIIARERGIQFWPKANMPCD